MSKDGPAGQAAHTRDTTGVRRAACDTSRGSRDTVGVSVVRSGREKLHGATALLRDGEVRAAWDIMAALRSEAVELDPGTRARVLELAARCASRLASEATKAGNNADAAGWYGELAGLTPDALEFRLPWARSLMAIGRLEEAWRILSALRQKLGASDGASTAAADGLPEGTPDLKERLARLSARCAASLGADAISQGNLEEGEGWHRTAAGLAPSVPEFQLGLAASLIRSDKFDDAWDILQALERDTEIGSPLRGKIRLLRGAHAQRRAYHAERPIGIMSIEGVDWEAVVSLRKQASELNPDLHGNWVHYVYALIYTGRSLEAKAIVNNPPSQAVRDHLKSYVGRAPEVLERQRLEGPFIYARHAPPYLSRGLPVVPAFGKRAIPATWGECADRPVRDDEYQSWRAIPWANIGLVQGPQSGVSIVDIDTDDPTLVRAIRGAIPPSPWERVGRKGMALAYRWTGLDSYKCLDSSGSPILDYHSTRTLIILPPSIHPHTGDLYRANCDLLDVLDELLPLPGDLAQRLSSALGPLGCTLRVVSRPGA